MFVRICTHTCVYVCMRFSRCICMYGEFGRVYREEEQLSTRQKKWQKNSEIYEKKTGKRNLFLQQFLLFTSRWMKDFVRQALSANFIFFRDIWLRLKPGWLSDLHRVWCASCQCWSGAPPGRDTLLVGCVMLPDVWNKCFLLFLFFIFTSFLLTLLNFFILLLFFLIYYFFNPFAMHCVKILFATTCNQSRTGHSLTSMLHKILMLWSLFVLSETLFNYFSSNLNINFLIAVFSSAFRSQDALKCVKTLGLHCFHGSMHCEEITKRRMCALRTLSELQRALANYWIQC